MSVGTQTDPELVAESLAGNREAFGEIVTRYQSLICSLAYSATGSLAQSEDLAQDTFLAAWKQMAGLREPGKLRGWLCGIARNLIHNQLRRECHQPAVRAESLEEARLSPGQEPLPVEEAISHEEEAILWRSLERIPELYREPLILFYREHQSIEQVAAGLELSEDAVKQRLSRGRKLLQDEIAAFVEGALSRTAPGKLFTMGVLAALPVLMTTSASAAALGATAMKGAAAAKSGLLMAWIGGILGPVLGILGGYMGYRTSMDTAYSDKERQFIKKFYVRLSLCIGGFALLMAPLAICSRYLVPSHPWIYSGLIAGLCIGYVAVISSLSSYSRRNYRKLAAEAAIRPPEEQPKFLWEYRTRLTVLGWPLIHIRMGGQMVKGRKAVRAWIAGGDTAIGLLFAFGGLAIAPISMGGCAVGLVSIGGFAVGALGFGGFALAVWAVGGFAFGWQAFGGFAIAWNAAVGGQALAREFALGGGAQALHANDEIARSFMQQNTFFTWVEAHIQYVYWSNLIWILPLVAWWRKARRLGNKT